MKSIGFFIFRRDLRLIDNLALIKLQTNVDMIIPLFILNKDQITLTDTNKYFFSSNAVQFICESLVDLNTQLTNIGSILLLLYGKLDIVISSLFSFIKSIKHKYNIVIGYNSDFSNKAKYRDKLIDTLAKKDNITIIKSTDDYSLVPINKLHKIDNTGYKQFGAFYKNIIKYKVHLPDHTKINFATNSFITGLQHNVDHYFNIKNINKFYKTNKYLAQNGGRTNALKKIKDLYKFKKYNLYKNMLDYSTTNLSAYLNMGCLSIREVYYSIKKILGLRNDLIRQLYWRDFYLQAYCFINNANKFAHIDNRYNKINWSNDHSLWNTLINSKTGFLLIDAAMNQLKITGFMHNRARILVGHFWTKYLLIDPFHKKYGSQVGFSKYLVDAIGPTQNKLNNQWITEFDYAGKKYAPKNIPLAGRPINVSNKIIYKYDPNCLYIKKWLPHLKQYTIKELANWKGNKEHPGPIFNYKIKYNEWIKKCKEKN